MFANYFNDMNFTRRLFATILLTISFICIYTSSYSQTDHSIGNWNTIFLSGKISPKWSLFLENHIRSRNYDFKFDYFEIKTGIGYSINRNLTGYIGTGFFNTDEPGGFFQTPALQKEFRSWIELNLKQNFNRFNFEHRARLEQRFIGDSYKNRLKYRLGLILPINKSEMDSGTIFLAVNDELFIPQYGSPVVEKNRLYIGVGYKMNKNAAIQIGCVSDTDYKLNSHSIKNYLQLMFVYNFTNLYKKHT